MNLEKEMYKNYLGSRGEQFGGKEIMFIEDAVRIAKQYAEEIEIEKEINEPYFGWCDVEGCHIEGCSGGNAWRETGYWTVCPSHAQDFRDGKPQPKMEDESIKKENSRDKKTGCLPLLTEEK